MSQFDLLSPDIDAGERVWAEYNIVPCTERMYPERRVWSLAREDGASDDYATVFAEFKHADPDLWGRRGRWVWSAHVGRTAMFEAAAYISAVKALLRDLPAAGKPDVLALMQGGKARIMGVEGTA